MLLIVSALSAVLGSMSVLGWAPYGWWPLSFACYAALFAMLSRSTGTFSATLIGLAFGMGLHLTGHGWMYAALHAKAGLGPALACMSTLIFILYLAAFIAIPCGLFKYIAPAADNKTPFGWPAILGFSGLLTLGEWARGTLFNGFTSLSLGYGLIDTWLAGYAPVAGVYAMSFLGYCIAGLIAGSVIARKNRRPALAAAMLLTLSGYMLSSVKWTQPQGPALSYRLIQSNVAQENKFDPRYANRYARHLAGMIESAPADLIVTPETAFTSFLNQLPGDVLLRIRQFSRASNSNVFLGIATESANSDGYNSVLHIRPDESDGVIPQYNKVHLMPFGEYSPAGFRWFTGLLSIPLKDMSAGEHDQRPFQVLKNGTAQAVGSLICQEDLTGTDARYWVNSANLLLNLSNLAWFEHSLAIPQRLQIVRMRALEVGRPILRVANTGITAQIEANGTVMQQLPMEQEGILSGQVQPTTGATPYSRVGDGLAVLFCIAGVFPCFYTALRARQSPSA